MIDAVPTDILLDASYLRDSGWHIGLPRLGFYPIARNRRVLFRIPDGFRLEVECHPTDAGYERVYLARGVRPRPGVPSDFYERSGGRRVIPRSPPMG